MDAAASSPTRMRRLMPWILWSSGGLSVLVITALVLWLWLPRWAPEWVVRYSPWVDPVLRAMASHIADRNRPLQMLDGFQERFTAGSPARPEVIAGLGSSDPNLRQVCVLALTDFNNRSSHPEQVQEKLIALALADENDEVRNFAYFALTPERSPRMSEVRARAMRDGEDWVRYEVVAKLDSRTSDLDWQTLLSALRDDDKDVRARAVKRVEELNEVRAVSRLIEMVTRDKDGLFRFVPTEVLLAVLSALGHFKVAEAVPVLTEFLDDAQASGLFEHFHDVSALLKTISTIDAAEGFRVREKILQGTHVGMRAFAAQELGESADQHAIEPLTKQLQDPEALVVGHVVIALCRLKAVSGVESILDLLEARRADLISLEIRQGNGNPTVGGRPMKVHFSDVIDQVATMPLTPQQRERLKQLREK